MQRKLTEHELTNKPGWATHYYITEYSEVVFESTEYFQHGLQGRRFKSHGYVAEGAQQIAPVPQARRSTGSAATCVAIGVVALAAVALPDKYLAVVSCCTALALTLNIIKGINHEN
ncbi:hypothetical protein L1285_16740 [Pseudoalteromonas sp. DL2-H2.2]|uniref:hypothetical protein n=1 Tax=Pseudoalteromonas sp. DL2-H2.2 TaxID=2908889 RepID=UPI001F1EE076|nr:hypothetical protein [Pseudoalteromonas sp. DL2-H2.2]MCF2909969.1 hypothetical protein [Pseudoalteromonas sp. DL2-H2.2]